MNMERLAWAFLQPSMDTLQAELREAKSTLILVLQVTTLAYHTKLAEQHKAPSAGRLTEEEQQSLIRAIVAYRKEHKTGIPASSLSPTSRAPPDAIVSSKRASLDSEAGPSDHNERVSSLGTGDLEPPKTLDKPARLADLPQALPNPESTITTSLDQEVPRRDVREASSEPSFVDRGDPVFRCHVSLDGQDSIQEESARSRHGLRVTNAFKTRPKFGFSSILPNRRRPRESSTPEIVPLNPGASSFEPELYIGLRGPSNSDPMATRLQWDFRATDLRLDSSEV